MVSHELQMILEKIYFRRFHTLTKWVYSNCTYQVGQNGDKIFETNNRFSALKISRYRSMYMRSNR